MASPTSLIPNAYMNLVRVVFLLFSIASRRFFADFSAKPSSANKSIFFKVYKSEKSEIRLYELRVQ